MTQCCMKPFWHSQDCLPEKNWKRAGKMRRICCSRRQLSAASKPEAATFGSGHGSTDRSGLKLPGSRHWVSRLILDGTCRTCTTYSTGANGMQKRLGKVCSVQQPSHKRRKHGGNGRSSHQPHRLSKQNSLTRGSKRQEQRLSRTQNSWKEAKQEGKRQLVTPKVQAPTKSGTDSSLNGSSMGTTKRVLGQDRVRHDVFPRVEQRVRSDELQEGLNKLGK